MQIFSTAGPYERQCYAPGAESRLAARDLDYMELYLGEDAAAFHRNQIEELALTAPGGGS